MQKKDTRSKRLVGHVSPSLYAKFIKFCEKRVWSESTGIQEAITRLIEK